MAITKKLQEKHRILIVGILLAIMCFLTYYFLVVLEVGIGFWHFFYFPIILASLWWKKKGMAVAIFLVLVLLAGHWFAGLPFLSIDDFARAGAFMLVAYVIGLVSERQAGEEGRLRQMSKVFTDSNDPIIIEDMACNITTMNDEAERAYGWKREELLGRPINTIIPAEHHRGADELRARASRGEQVRNVERVRLNKSGRVIPILVTLSLLTDEKGKPVGIATIAKDLSDIKELQERLVRSEKMVVLGQLAGGVGHELRNPLGVIKNAAYFLNMALEDPEPEVKETLELLEREVATSERIISSLLDYARPKPPISQTASINDIVQKALARIAIPQNVEVVSRLDEALPIIIADTDQLGQVFANVILNAIQAMPDGGRLLLKSEVGSPGWVAISFADTGIGIPKENLSKIFEPIFTTKAKGIGLGLALTKILVEGQGGTIEVESEIGKGSTFTVRLPVGG